MLLNYLIGSRHRRQLLWVLTHQEQELTVSDLARQAGTPYSGTHKEVRELGRLDLLKTRHLGGAVVCRWNRRHPFARAVRNLFEADRAAKQWNARASQGDADVLRNLKRWGAPLTKGGLPKLRLPIEETLARALVVARVNATVAQVLPVVFAKNRGTLDLPRLEMLARRVGEKRTLGFFLALCAHLMKDDGWARYSKKLKDRRFRRTEDFFLNVRGKRSRKLAEKNTPALAREWNFRMNMPMKSLESAFHKFAKGK